MYRKFIGTYRRESINFMESLDNKVEWFYQDPKTKRRRNKKYWAACKPRLMDVLEHEWYSDELLRQYLYRLGDISESYKMTNEITMDDWLADDFLAEVDRLKTIVWEMVEWKNPNLYKLKTVTE